MKRHRRNYTPCTAAIYRGGTGREGGSLVIFIVNETRAPPRVTCIFMAAFLINSRGIDVFPGGVISSARAIPAISRS